MIRMMQDEWISIGDEIPELGVDVLVFVFDNLMPECKYACTACFEATEKGWNVVGYKGVTVTHWMPLPASPR